MEKPKKATKQFKNEALQSVKKLIDEANEDRVMIFGMSPNGNISIVHNFNTAEVIGNMSLMTRKFLSERETQKCLKEFKDTLADILK